MRWTVPVALVGVLLLAGCAGDRQPAGSTTAATATPTASATASATPRPTTSATPSPTASAPATSTPAPSTGAPVDPVVLPLDSVIDACTSWQTSLGQDAATFPATQARAAQLASAAAAVDAEWQPLATDMATLVSIGSDTSAAAVAQGQALFTDLSTRCGEAGVTVSAG